MERQVFISYAANDLDWTEERVAEFAARLDALQVRVHLDVRHQRSVGEKLALAEWWDWMEVSMTSATYVVCLCSDRYAEAWKRKESVSGGCGVAFESTKIIDYLYDEKQNNKGRVLTVVGKSGHRGMIPKALKTVCPYYQFGDPEDDLLLWSHLSGQLPDESGPAQQDAPDAIAPTRQPSVSEAEQFAETAKKQDLDLLDRAWRKALEQCSAKVRALVCEEMDKTKTFEGRLVAPACLEKALTEAFERVAPVDVLTDVRYALGSPKKGFSELNSDECRQRGALYVLLMVRAVALWRQSDLRIEAAGGAIVPDADDSKRLAIAVVAHLMSGQGILLNIEPDTVRADNLLDAAALTDAHAYPPGQPSGPSPLEREVSKWLGRVLNDPNVPRGTELLKAFLDRFEDDHHARPILLDREASLVDPKVKALLEQLGIGVVGIAANDRPANIPPDDWQTLCHTFELKASDLTGQAPAKSAPPEPKPQPAEDTQPQPSQPPSQVQVHLHQTISGAVGQSNVTTGNHSPIQAQHAAVAPPSAPPDAAQDALALAVFAFERTLNDHADLKNDLRELHALVLRRDASPPALSLLPRLLRPLREAVHASPGAAHAWERLRNAVYAHWPQSRDFF